MTPGVQKSARVIEMPDPSPAEAEVLVETSFCALDGTDREILAGYGRAPEEDDFLVIGHEAVGVVRETGSAVAGLAVGDVVVPMVRRPDPQPCASCAAGEWDMCENGRFTERGIIGRHGFLSEAFVDDARYLIRIPAEMRDLGVLIEPLSIVEKALEHAWRIQERFPWRPSRAAVLGAGPIGLLTLLALRSRGLEVVLYSLDDSGPRARIVETTDAHFVAAREGVGLDNVLPWKADLIVEATGFSPLAIQAIHALARNGVVCLLGVSTGTREIKIDSDAFNGKMVLQGHAIFGSVSSNRRHFSAAITDLIGIEQRWPGLASSLLTSRSPLDRFAEALEPDPSGVKPVVDMAGET